jgi:spore maturation protein CgeB
MSSKCDVLLVHPGASWSTADVFNGLKFGMQYHGAKVGTYQLDVRISRSARWLRWNWTRSGKDGAPPNPRDAQYHAASGVIERACRLDPEWVFIVSGMYFDLDLIKFLKRCGFKVAILLTESPYDDDAQVEVVKHLDIAFTNERSSVERLRAGNPNVHYLPHAWHPAIHVPQLIGNETDVAAHDVLFIGTGFTERIAFLKAVDWQGLDLALYGYWTKLGSRATLRTAVRGGVVPNASAAQLYQRARINLNLHRTSKGVTANAETHIDHAESLNPRVFELAACGAFFVTDSRAELIDIFGAGVIPTFETPEELSEQLARFKDDEKARRLIAGAAHECIKPHAWTARAETVLATLNGSIEPCRFTTDAKASSTSAHPGPALPSSS